MNPLATGSHRSAIGGTRLAQSRCDNRARLALPSPHSFAESSKWPRAFAQPAPPCRTYHWCGRN